MTTPTTSQSLTTTVLIGPRPLHLTHAQVNSSHEHDALSASRFQSMKRFSMPPASISSPTTKVQRRQSSICYFPADSTSTPRRGAFRNSLAHVTDEHEDAIVKPSIVSSPIGNANVGADGRNRWSTASLPTQPVASSSASLLTPEKDRPPLTLTEKHADLLRFIAQKEAKCLELRSQLAVHETELQQLKQKWERIVNRGLERDATRGSSGVNGSDLLNANVMYSSNGSGGAVVLEGIKEGVQGVSRLFAASFSISDPKPSPAPSPTPSPSLPASLNAPHKSRLSNHSTKTSSSSISTFATGKSVTRFSLSSTSSFGEDVHDVGVGVGFIGLSTGDRNGSHKKHDDGNTLGNESDNGEILIVRDTGATPTMSPNPEYHQQKFRREMKMQHKEDQRRKLVLPQQEEKGEDNDLWPGARGTRGSFEKDEEVWSSSIQKGTAKARRRKSKDVSLLVPLESPVKCESPLQSHLDPGSITSSSSRSVSPSVLPPESKKDQASKRASLSGGLPPMASIPGLGSLTTGAVSPPPVGVWMDTMGKKLGQLQRSSTFTKGQKRASLLFSDMSQSIVSALGSSSPAPLPSATTNHRIPSPLPPASSSTSTTPNLIDDDDDDTMRFNSVMLTPAQIPVTPSTPAMIAPVEPAATVKVGDLDDDWNW